LVAGNCWNSNASLQRRRWNKIDLEEPTSGDIKVMPTILFSWVMLSIVVGVAADSRGRNPAWFFLALMFSPVLAALLLLALPNLKTERQWHPFIQAVIGWSRGRPCNSKGAARTSTFTAPALTADRIDYWIRRHVIEHWDETHPSQLKLNPGRDRRVGLSAIGQCKDQYGALATPIAPHLAALVKQLETQKQE
jgi:hypothetical protein